MSQSPANGKGATTVKRMEVPQAKGAAKEAAPATGKGLTPEQQKKVVILSAGLVVLLTFMGLYVYFNYLKKPTYTEPPMNGTHLEMAKFVQTPKFDQLQFERWMLWVQKLEDDKKEFRQLYADGKINKDEMINILSHAWVAEEYNDMNKYYNIGSPVGRRERLREMAIKDLKKNEEKGAKPEDLTEVKRDKNKSKALLEARFPEDKKREYTMYKQAYDEIEKQVEKELKAQRKHDEAIRAMRPTTRASTPPVKPQ